MSKILRSCKNVDINFSYIDKIPKKVKEEIDILKKSTTQIPLVINGEKIYTMNTKIQFSPYNKHQPVCNYNVANLKHIKSAIKSSQQSIKNWKEIPLNKKYDIFSKASELIVGKYYNKLLATTMLGQGKNIYQAEIDAICELADFINFNIKYHQELHQEQPISVNHELNKSSWTGLNGFVGSITPFNFTAIAGHLATAPLLMNNPVVWKPSDSSILSNYLIYEIMVEAGMPEDAIQFVPSNPELFLDTCLESRDFAGLAFTGSSDVFNSILKKSYSNIGNYKSYPRIIGETGGNNYHFVFPNCDFMLDHIVTSTIRGAFEFSGQKCSATSRIYLPKSIFNDFMNLFESKMSKLNIGSPEEDFNFTSAVIHKNSFNKCKNWIDLNKEKVIYGGNYDDSLGYFVDPTIIKYDDINDPKFKNEIFGPILSLYVYDDNKLEETIESCTKMTDYNLTGSVFSQNLSDDKLINKYFCRSVGNLYINDKSTGSVVGQQPFGGFGKSGTNDKAGSKYFLTRFGNNVITKFNLNKTPEALRNCILN